MIFGILFAVVLVGLLLARVGKSKQKSDALAALPVAEQARLKRERREAELLAYSAKRAAKKQSRKQTRRNLATGAVVGAVIGSADKQ